MLGVSTSSLKRIENRPFRRFHISHDAGSSLKQLFMRDVLLMHRTVPTSKSFRFFWLQTANRCSASLFHSIVYGQRWNRFGRTNPRFAVSYRHFKHSDDAIVGLYLRTHIYLFGFWFHKKGCNMVKEQFREIDLARKLYVFMFFFGC